MIERNLDKIISEAPAGAIIKLEPGEYTTMGYGTYPSQPNLGVKVKPNTTILGSVVSPTIIKCIRTTGDCTVIHTDENCVVKDLQINCNPPAGVIDIKRSGLRCEGSAYIYNVSVANLYGTLAHNRESFGIVAGHDKPGLGTIIKCTVFNILGDYTSAIMGNYVDSCNVIWREPLSDEVNTPRFRVAYNIGNSKFVKIFNSRCSNADAAVYSDTAICEGAKIHNNTFYNVRIGINLNAQTKEGSDEVTGIKGVEFINNNVTLQATGVTVAAIQLDHSTSDSVYRENTKNYIQDCHIADNIVQFNPQSINLSKTVPKYPYAVNCASYTPREKISSVVGITGILFERNYFDSRLLFRNRSNNANLNIDATVTWQS